MAVLGELSRNVGILLGQIQRCELNGSVINHDLKSVHCMSQAAPQPEPTVDNEAVNPTFVNRNPRNLEQMALAVKDRGWRTTWPSQKFYHRLVFSRSQHHLTGEVFANGDPVPVLLCSTKEWALKHELGSTRCVAASQAVGEVLAQRCRQAGIIRMVYRHIPWQYRSDAVHLAPPLHIFWDLIGCLAQVKHPHGPSDA
uniref:Large ribosomal subunit protein uL18m n=1 Tax=Hucho hucho TaxID=62062 RepID=A0A4W5PE55_9TELE